MTTEERGESADRASPWWRSAVVYHVYPRSFSNANGDGVGDLEGVRRRLDHLSWLGVDAIWLSPFYPSPMADGGYDVADHCDVAPIFGSLDDFDRLLAAVHDRGMRLLVDWVPNHTSDQHPWFVESRSSRNSPKRDWYIWRNEPNNWRAAFEAGSAWTYDDRTGQYYLHLFLPEQPDLNWRNPEVIEAMHGVLRFWLDRGVDGFRIDVAHCIGKDPSFADDPRCLAGEPLANFNDQPYTHEVLRGVRALVDSYPGDRVIVGEVNIRRTEAVVRYYGAGDQLHLSFNFPPIDAPWDAVVFGDVIAEVEEELRGAAAWPTWVLSNHDHKRHRTRYGGSLQRARAAAVMLLTLRGTPFLYQGEELGLEDARIAPEREVDPGGRDPARAPIPWEPGPPHGWDGAEPWLPFPAEADQRNATSLRRDAGSILHLYRRLLALRRASPALSLGAFEMLDVPPEVLAYRRRRDDDERIVVVNFADRERSWNLGPGWRVELASRGGDGDGAPFEGGLPPETALVLRPSA